MAQFPKPVLPRPSNSTGPPTPPSGFHPTVSPQVGIVPTNGTPPVGPPSGVPASNIHGSPRGRLARLLRRDRDYDLLRSVW